MSDRAAIGSIRSVATFSTGRVQIHPQHVHGARLPALSWILFSRSWDDWRPIHVFVVEHPNGLVLFDSGQDPASVSDPGYYPSSRLMRLIYSRLARFEIGPQDTVTVGLRSLGYEVRDVRYVVLSHLHQDHIGGLGELTAARFVVAEREWEAMKAPNAETAGYLPRHTDLPDATWTKVVFGSTADAGLSPFAAAHDLLGDGSLVLLPTPGHTPGSLSMLVRTENTPLLLVGDLTYDLAAMHNGAVPGIGRRAELRDSSAKVLEFERRSGGVTILPAHDRGSSARLRAIGGRTA
jgi:glyoxylase-like metal-dependent hydrolase (beta-lactamase superfamily II)